MKTKTIIQSIVAVVLLVAGYSIGRWTERHKVKIDPPSFSYGYTDNNGSKWRSVFESDEWNNDLAFRAGKKIVPTKRFLIALRHSPDSGGTGFIHAKAIAVFVRPSQPSPTLEEGGESVWLWGPDYWMP